METEGNKGQVKPAEETPQMRFDKTYVTTSDLSEAMGVIPSVIRNSNSDGKMPNAVRISHGRIHLWERILLDSDGTAQERFDKKYITAGEIIERLGITRAALLYARRMERIPGAILVGKGSIYIWERESVEPYLNAWHTVIKARRGY